MVINQMKSKTPESCHKLANNLKRTSMNAAFFTNHFLLLVEALFAFQPDSLFDYESLVVPMLITDDSDKAKVTILNMA